MRTQIILWILVAAVLCLASFWIGGLHHPQSSFDVNPLIRDRGYLEALRAGYTSNVIESLEVHLDLEVFDAMKYRPSLQGRKRELLDSALSKVAHYREQYPRQIPAITGRDTSILGSNTVKGYQDLYAKQKQVDAFLRTFAVTNE